MGVSRASRRQLALRRAAAGAETPRDRVLRGARLLAGAAALLALGLGVVVVVRTATAGSGADPRLVWGLFSGVSAATAAGCLSLVRRWSRAARAGLPAGTRGAGVLGLAGPLGAGAGVLLAPVLPPLALALLLAVGLGVVLVCAGWCAWLGSLSIRHRHRLPVRRREPARADR